LSYLSNNTYFLWLGGETSAGLSLVAFDTDHIKEYVFGTDRLKEIRGASSLLDRLNRREMEEVPGSTVSELDQFTLMVVLACSWLT
jgi:hypothetical protein